MNVSLLHFFCRPTLALVLSLTTSALLPLGHAQAKTCSCKGHTALSTGLFVSLQAKPGKEAELATFLGEAQKMAEAEKQTPLWFAVRLEAQKFAIFDAFADDAGRQAHLGGEIAAALMAKASTLLAEPPKIEKFSVLGQKRHN